MVHMHVPVFKASHWLVDIAGYEKPTSGFFYRKVNKGIPLILCNWKVSVAFEVALSGFIFICKCSSFFFFLIEVNAPVIKLVLEVALPFHVIFEAARESGHLLIPRTDRYPAFITEFGAFRLKFLRNSRRNNGFSRNQSPPMPTLYARVLRISIGLP
ncbi:hypothetical protein [Acidiphilium sp. C61]|uniref:hypothetical protein n=1 Tax=Acidiphilium sp. C61 TaxID=1671485 RepID=UPI001C2DE886|nr:hypothetical protein [Acidiphilium sp. C61]